MTRQLLVAGLVAAAALASCERTSSQPTPALPKDTLAAVNGQPITEYELQLRLRASPGAKPGERPAAETRQAALDAIVLQELQAQRALELGLDAEPSFREQMWQVEAQLREVRRRELAKLYRTKEVFEKSVVTVEDARRYFDENTARVQMEVRVLQIFVRGRPAADQAAAALAKGAPFEEVAAAQFSQLPPNEKPWALPVLAWDQVPPQWWADLDRLQVGGVSGILAAPGDRYWIIKLVEKRQQPALTFEAAMPRIQALLKSDKFEERRDQLEKELRGKAKIELFQPAPGPSAD